MGYLIPWITRFTLPTSTRKKKTYFKGSSPLLHVPIHHAFVLVKFEA
jgi:hypothetical protein